MDPNIDLSKLTDNDKKELQQFIMQENQQSMIAKSIDHFLPCSVSSISIECPVNLYRCSHIKSDRHLLEEVHHIPHLNWQA